MANQPGLSLADLAPITVDVPLGTSFIRVRGVAAKDIVMLLRRFPQVTKMLTGGGFNISDLLTVAPEAVAAIITYATDTSDEFRDSAEAAASILPVEVQTDLIEAIGGLTFKSGFGPFAKRVMDAAGAVNSTLSTKVPAMKSPQPSSNSSPPATTPTPSGDTPLGK